MLNFLLNKHAERPVTRKIYIWCNFFQIHFFVKSKGEACLSGCLKEDGNSLLRHLFYTFTESTQIVKICCESSLTSNKVKQYFFLFVEIIK